jgi:hypothetical protein
MADFKNISIPTFNKKILLEDYFRLALFGPSASGKTWWIKKLLKDLVYFYNRVFIFTLQHNKEDYEEILEKAEKEINKYKNKDILEKEIDVDGGNGGEALKDAEKDLKKLGKLFAYKIIYDKTFEEVMSLVQMIKSSNMIKIKSKTTDKIKEIIPYNILIILDDQITNKASKNEYFHQVFASCRHNHISIIYLIQYMNSEYMNDDMRNNCTHLAFCKPNSHNSRILIKNNYIAPTVDEYLETLNKEDDVELAKKIKSNILKSIFSDEYAKLIFVCKNAKIYYDPSK